MHAFWVTLTICASSFTHDFMLQSTFGISLVIKATAICDSREVEKKLNIPEKQAPAEPLGLLSCQNTKRY